MVKPAKKASGGTGKKMTPYNAFMKKELAVYKAAHPGVNHQEAFKKVASMWKDAPENPKREK